MPGTKNVYKQLGKSNYNHGEISGKFGVVPSTDYQKVNTTDTDKNLFRLVRVLGHGAQVLPLELEPVPEHGAKFSAQAPTKGYVQTGARARCLGRAFRMLSLLHVYSGPPRPQALLHFTRQTDRERGT